jgi:hypothetical protein
MKTIVQIIVRKLKKFIRLASPDGELIIYGDKKKPGSHELI